MTEERDWEDPRYKAARLAAFKRDKFHCRFPNCDSNLKINAHHIQTWAHCHELRYEVTNLITLCKKHHTMVTGHESEYAAVFSSILGCNDFALLMIQMRHRAKPN